MSTQWKVGDLVVLKSGGPLMTVTKTYNSDNGPMIRAEWFDKDNKPEQVMLPADSVEAG